MSKNKIKHYSVADKAWQFVAGCSPSMPCAKRCWARRTVARVVECQKEDHPERAEFFQIALTPDGKQWSGEVYLDMKHLQDPMHWKRPAVIASGFHGDWGRLIREDLAKVFAVMSQCPQHLFMPLTKQPQELMLFLGNHPKIATEDAVVSFTSSSVRLTRQWPLQNVSIGCSVMNQAEADRCFPHMFRISQLGWRTHVWYEPAIGPINWSGWEFLEQILVGGESGNDARPCFIEWIRDTIKWCESAKVNPFIKQLGANAKMRNPNGNCRSFTCTHPACTIAIGLTDRKGANPIEWPKDLRVRKMLEVPQCEIQNETQPGETS